MVGVCAALLAFGWQFLIVHFNYGGNWTALYLIGPRTPVPAMIANEHLYIFPNNSGYDGQSFHLMAHDPWMRRNTPDALEIQPFRYARILVPAVAWMLALGQDRWIDRAYFAVIHGFVFLGAFWLALVAARASLHPAWGLAFLLSPAALTSIDRMTVDIALSAFCVALVLYADRGWRWSVLIVLACALLTRETAWILFCSYALFLLVERRLRDLTLAAAAAIPAIAWEIYLTIKADRLADPPHLLGWIPLQGYFRRLGFVEHYDLPQRLATLAVVFDYVALAGMATALALAIWVAIRNRTHAISFNRLAVFVIGGYAIAMVFLNGGGEWGDAFAFGRIFAPLPLLLSIYYLPSRPWLGLLPTLMIDSRIALNFGKHAQEMIQRWMS